MKSITIVVFLSIVSLAMLAQKSTKGFSFVEKKDKKQIDVLWNGKLLTAYCYYDSVMKPFLFPLKSVDGITVSRGYPIQPVNGERTDHPHHTGMWMNYESVNGLDFWNNSTAITADKKHRYGTIRHAGVIDKKVKGNQAFLTVSANWQRPDGVVLLIEKTTYDFTVRNNEFFIVRNTTLTAAKETVVFNDVKDGFFAIRVARELEMPSKEAAVFVDARGNKTNVPAIDNNHVSGMYYNSDGVKGDAVWSTSSPWAMLTGQKDGKEITIGIFDHPANKGYPGYWHARGYGLFAINPLGRKVFSNGKEELNLTLQPGASVNFRYQVLITSGKKMDASEMNKLAVEFGKK